MRKRESRPAIAVSRRHRGVPLRANRRPRPNRRRLSLELLEHRRLLASDWLNPHTPLDVSFDGPVTPIDALLVINQINDEGSGALPALGGQVPDAYVDTNGDQFLSPLDALLVINIINFDPIAPVVVAGLSRDTAPGGRVNSDGRTFDGTIVGTATDERGIGQLVAMIDDQPAVDVDVSPAGTFTLAASLVDGAHTVRLVAFDPYGVASPPRDVSFVLDRTPPSAATLELSRSSDTHVSGDQTTSARRVTLSGTTASGVTVSLPETGASSLASYAGQFQFPDVPLRAGENSFTARVADEAGNVADTVLTITHVVPSPDAELDPALSWTQELLEAVRRDATSPPLASRTMAMLALAMHDTVNGIDSRPAYLVHASPPSLVSIEAAVAGAAERVLRDAYPGQAEYFAGALSNVLARVPDGEAETAGLVFGQNIAEIVLGLREADGWLDFVDYRPTSSPGLWEPTPPMYDPALLPQWADLAPFSMSSPSQFRPDGPPALDSAQYAAAFDEVRRYGQASGSSRTAEQTQIARFWSDGPGTYTPPGHWNQIAIQLARDSGLGLSDSVRLLAQLNVALADAAIVAWDAKYAYDGWRPITAIQRADSDGNPSTDAVPDWTPLLITPPFPEYVSGHSTFSGAAATILSSFFGEQVTFLTTALGLPGVERSFDSLWEAATEAGQSRIYGGIHFQFANQDGLAAGSELAEHVLSLFQVVGDVQGPRIHFDEAHDQAIRPANTAVTGQVIDNLSGVAVFEVQVDDGEFKEIALDDTGHFAFLTSFAADGSQDGTHHVRFRASDFLGNVSPTTSLELTLDTVAPLLTIDSPAANGELNPDIRLQGEAHGTGSPIVALTYRANDGAPRPIPFDSIDGRFATPLDLSRLPPGDVEIVVEATDAAGHRTSVTRSTNLPQRIPFSVTSFTPIEGSDEVGTTFRPQIHFSRPIDPASLTSDNFFALAPSQLKLPATIVPALDGSFAWLFFDDPLPGGSRIEVQVVGDTLRAAEGGLLDADGDGAPGGRLQFSFTTVSLAPVAETSLSGQVVDPGPDLKPMSRDDMLAGPDGVLHTSDDLYLLPLEHVKVFLVGREDEAVFTDSQGRFEFAAVPAGNLKLAVDGRTATNVPQGVFFPEMVMDLTVAAGRANTVMGTMGTAEEQTANLARPEVYLPRLRESILQPVSETQVTTVGVDPLSAPNLTDGQRSQLRLEVQPGSVLGFDGQPLDQPRVGISTVPPELVREMLPPGVLQHTFDITIQAPEAATFAVPLELAFPNVFAAPPGSQLSFLSFDHTTGRLVIEGTATVSPDGLSVVTDPGSGITKPGWHGLTPPGIRSDPPCDPKAVHSVPVEPQAITAGLRDYFFVDDNNSFTLSFGNAASKIDPKQDPCHPDNVKATPLVVEIQTEGSFQFIRGLPRKQTFKLLPGQQKNIKVALSNLLAGRILNGAAGDALHGARIKVTAYQQDLPGDKLIDEEVYVYRFFDSGDDDHTDGTSEYPKTLMDGPFGAFQDKMFQSVMPGIPAPTFRSVSLDRTFGENFEYRGDRIRFDPLTATGILQDAFRVITPEGNEVGRIAVSGTAIEKQRILFPRSEFRAAVVSLVDRDPLVPNTESFVGIFPVDTDNDRLRSDEAGFEAIFDQLHDEVSDFLRLNLQSASPLVGSAIEVVDATAGDGIKINYFNERFSETSIPFASRNVDRLGDAVDVTDATDVTLHLRTGTIPAGTRVDVAIQKSDDLSNWTTILQASLTSAASNQNFTQRFTAAQLDQDYVRIVSTHSGGGQAAYGALFEGTRNRCGSGAACAVWDDFDRDEFMIGGGVNSVTKRPIPITGGFVKVDHSMSRQQELFQFAEITNRSYSDPGPGFSFEGVVINLDVKAQQVQANPGAHLTFLDNMAIRLANSMSHEVGHDLGTIHVRSATDLYVGTTIMGKGSQHNELRTWGRERLAALLLGLGLPATPAQFTPTYVDYKKFIGYEVPGYNPGEEDIGRHHNPGDDLSIDGPYAAVFDGPLVVGQELPAALEELDFGATVSDGAAGAFLERTVILFNDGGHELEVTGISLADGARGFQLVAGGTPVTLPPLDPEHPEPHLSSHAITVRFDPRETGDAVDSLLISSNTLARGVTQLRLAGSARSPFGDLRIEVANNNLGGLSLGDAPLVASNFATIRNEGAGPLTIREVTMGPMGGVQFQLTDLPDGLGPDNPLVLPAGESFQIGLSFDARLLGLQPGEILVISDDPETPVLRQAVIGTGLPDQGGVLDYGQDFVAIESLSVNGAPILRDRSDPAGNFSFFLPADEAIHLTIFDPVSGLVAHSYDATAASGSRLAFGAPVFLASVEPDTDGDFLPDDIEFAIGTSANKPDSDGDGIGDFQEIGLGLDPLGGRGVPTGVVAALSLLGEARDLVIGDVTQAGQERTAYVATGTYGLAIADISSFSSPVLLSQLDLPGDNQDVAVDSTRDLAVVAGGSTGVHLVDVANRAKPVLLRSITLEEPAARVTLLDGTAYVAAGRHLVAIDLVTDDVRQLVTAASITDIATEGTTLFTMDINRVLRSIDIAGFSLIERESLALPDGGAKLYVADGIAYAPAANNGFGGLATVDVSDPDNLILISGSDANTGLARTAFASNGSGIGLLVGATSPASGLVNAVDVLDISAISPADTGNFLTRFVLRDTPSAVAIADGLGFVTASTAGLQIINFLPIDTDGVPPTVRISSPTDDVDDGTPGVQVLEGAAIPIRAEVTDDVQVSRVEFLANGELVGTDLTFPFEMTVPAPLDVPPFTALEVVARATDTGGNSTRSLPAVFQIVPDTVPPTVSLVSPSDLEQIAPGLTTVRIQFSEPLDPATVNHANFQLRNQNSEVIPASGMELRLNGRTVLLRFDSLPAGDYQLSLQNSVTDLAGNSLEEYVSRFTVVSADVFWIGGSGRWSDGTNWNTGSPPGAADHVLISVAGEITVTLDNVSVVAIASLSSNERIVIDESSSLTLLEPSSLRGGLDLLDFNNNRFHATDAVISGTSTWGAGVVTGSVTNQGELTLSREFGSIRSLGHASSGQTGTLINQGTLHDLAGLSFNHGTLDNRAGALYEVSGAIGGLFQTSGANAVLNAGTVRRQASTAPIFIDVPFTNQGGLLEVHGELDLRNHFTSTAGTVIVGSGGNLDFQAGTFEFDANSSITASANSIMEIGNFNADVEFTVRGLFQSAGTVVLHEPDFILNSAATVANIEMNDGTLRGSGSLALSGTSIWSDTDILLAGGLANSGTLTIAMTTGFLTRSLATTFTNHGTVVHAGSISLNGGAVHNNAEAIYDLQGTGSLRNGSGTNAFNNAGTLLRSAITNPSDVANVDVPFNNASGTIDIRAGRITFTRGGVNSDSEYLLSASATLEFSGSPTHTWGGSTTVDGDGTLRINNGNLLVAALGNAVIDLDTGGLQIAGGTLAVDGEIHNEGLVSWTGGTISGTGRFTNRGTLNTSGGAKTLSLVLENRGTFGHSGSLTISNSTLNNHGTFAQTSGMNLANSTIQNLAGGLYDLQLASGVALVQSSGVSTFDNGGTLRRSSTANANSIAVPFINRGTIEILSGSLGFSSTWTQTGGITQLSGGNLSSTQTLTIQGGMLTGAGTVAGNIHNGGTIAPGASPGSLAITGSLTQSEGGMLTIEIGGLSAGTQFDQLTVSGTATLNGTLNLALLDGFEPSLSDSFSIITFGSHTGSFDTLNGLDLPGDKRFVPQISATQFVLATAAALKASGERSAPRAVNRDGDFWTPILASAIDRWEMTGHLAGRTHSLDRITVRVEDLPGSLLALTWEHQITIDVNAAGFGWFVDPTPDDDWEFDVAGEDCARNGAADRIDLLTALAHELGHLLGLPHDETQDDVMYATLAASTRRRPRAWAFDAILRGDS